MLKKYILIDNEIYIIFENHIRVFDKYHFRDSNITKYFDTILVPFLSFGFRNR